MSTQRPGRSLFQQRRWLRTKGDPVLRTPLRHQNSLLRIVRLQLVLGERQLQRQNLLVVYSAVGHEYSHPPDNLRALHLAGDKLLLRRCRLTNGAGSCVALLGYSA